MEEWRSEYLKKWMKEWQEIKPRTVQTVKAWPRAGREDEAELSFKPGALITGVRPASWIKGD